LEYRDCIGALLVASSVFDSLELSHVGAQSQILGDARQHIGFLFDGVF